MVGATTMPLPVPPPPPPPVGGFPAPPHPPPQPTCLYIIAPSSFRSGTFCARAVCTALTTSGRAVQQPSRATVQNHGRPTRF
ncbi:hypothetical protein COOONC_26526 [Cooperia oncophora]